ncbi:hypothetical protein Moror_3775 [Moniliophthora roreri MCA 2997]|uniref:Uncharacterized protein n=1 Tax=Moniliophthora roreri (strain MCA 2997) TaxID=1381753 RepID=V2WUR2_MONRO|nr:hypothetical protein Moror_3775 [Moniliophthora roreri MCA 2997]
MHCNNSPSDREVNSIRKVVAKVERELEDLIPEIRRLKRIVKELERARDALQSFSLQHKALLLPLRKIPTESLGIIFEFCMSFPSSESRDALDFWDTTQAPWVLTQVSQRWRSVALHTPRLWENVTINAEPLKRPKQHRLKLLQTCLDRVGNHPIRLRLHLEYDRKEDRAILDTLVRYSLQWQSLELKVPVAMFKRMLPVSGRLPLLQKLKIHVQHYHAEDVSEIFSNAPVLRDARIFVVPFYDIYPSFPFRQLVRLAGTYNVELALRVLGEAKRLEDCRLLVHDRGSFLPMPLSMISLTHLRFLDIRVEKDLRILDFIDVPCLEILRLEGMDRPTPGTEFRDGRLKAAPILELLRRSSPPLVSLRIQDSFWNERDFNSLLRAVPTVHELHVSLIQVLVSFPDLLCTCGGEILLPKLEGLSLEVHSQMNAEGLLDLLESRYQKEATSSVACLRRCRIRTAARFQPSVHTMVRLEKLKAEGMDVSVTDQRYS